MIRRLVADRTDLLQGFLVLDAMPVCIFVVDAALEILYINAAARHDFDTNGGAVLHKRIGEVLGCLCVSQTPSDCGIAENCSSCAICRAAAAAVDGQGQGQKTHRQHVAMQLHYGSDVRDVHFLLTAEPTECEGATAALLVLEDISDLVQLNSFLPICASCKQVRSDQAYLDRIERYLQSHRDAAISQGLCPDCCEQLNND